LNIIAESKPHYSRYKDDQGGYWRSMAVSGSNKLLIRLRAEFDANMTPPKGWRKRTHRTDSEIPPAPVVAPVGSNWFQVLDEQVHSIAMIQTIVAKYYGITRRDIVSHRRTKDILVPRQIATYIAKELTPFSLPVLGRHFGGRDHTTMLHSIKKIAKLIRTDADLAYDVARLFILITGAPL